jgi:ABC-2 type transport system ATP-binding protein
MTRVEGLNKFYKKLHALKGIDLHVAKGELFSYLGPNGAGKSTTIRILTGLTTASSGRIFLNDVDIERDRVRAREQCGLVPQSINLDQELTVFENLNVHGMLFHMPNRKRFERIDELLEYVGLIERKGDLVNRLSGGMRRRLMIARALMHSPKILFLDEPTVGLAIRRRIWALIKKIQQNGTTIFLTTQYIEEAEFLAQWVAFLDEGRIVAIDAPQNLMPGLGSWAVDAMMEDDMETVYFAAREEANQYIAMREGLHVSIAFFVSDCIRLCHGK